VIGFDGPAMSSGSRQLTSWKEIAHYLGINVRTAQKWERERGLPIHRVPGARSRVSADALSLDTWKQQLACSTKQEDCCYCWPLGQGLRVEVRFLGADLQPAHIDLLREYLNLVKTAISTNTTR
jgi:excisionase family DNA binding protein